MQRYWCLMLFFQIQAPISGTLRCNLLSLFSVSVNPMVLLSELFTFLKKSSSPACYWTQLSVTRYVTRKIPWFLCTLSHSNQDITLSCWKIILCNRNLSRIFLHYNLHSSLYYNNILHLISRFILSFDFKIWCMALNCLLLIFCPLEFYGREFQFYIFT